MQRKRNKFLKRIILLIVTALAALAIINYKWIYDFWRGISYSPSAEVAEIRDRLELADYGAFLFNASQPVLSNRDEFNEKCRGERDEEDAILGCYTDEDIYVYNIVDEKLDGIRECTIAHELLHAVWRRMDNSEQEKFDGVLSKVYEQNKSFLAEELGIYEEDERREELYVRAGTEVKNLPEELEQHFKQIFKNQDKVVGYYDKYIKVFRDLQAELDSLNAEIEKMRAEIKIRETDYEQRAERLSADIAEFNRCAETVGCFTNQWNFDRRRNALVSEQSALEALYDEVNKLVDECNAKIEKYNDDVISNNQLNQVINSTVEVDAVGT